MYNCYVVADKNTVIGGREKDHDLSALKGKRLRTHGSLHEANVPFIISEPLNDKYLERAVQPVVVMLLQS